MQFRALQLEKICVITVVAKKEFFIRATGLLPNIIYYELLKLIYAYIKKAWAFNS